MSLKKTIKIVCNSETNQNNLDNELSGVRGQYHQKDKRQQMHQTGKFGYPRGHQLRRNPEDHHEATYLRYYPQEDSQDVTSFR
jgi:hypothetical protein